MGNGYVIYPDSIGVMLKAKAIAKAKKLSKESPNERYWVESVDTQKVVARLIAGRIQNPSARPATKRARIAVLKSTTGYKDRAGKFHATGAAKKNPAAGFPVGKFVKVDAVKVNRNGTIDVMRPTSKRPKR